MAVTFTPTEPLQGTLTIHITEAEYQPILNKEITNYKSKAQLKGFRKGKTSADLIKKLYGGAILQEVIEKTLQNQLMEHIRENKLQLLGQPIGNENQPQISYDIFNPSEFKFIFDIGYAHEFEIKGLDKTFSLNKVKVGDDKVDEQFENLRRRMGELKEVEGPVTEDHLLAIKAIELENGQPKENGIETEFSLWLSQIDDAGKDLFIGKKKGDTLDADLHLLHPDKDEAFIKSKYFTKLDENTAVPALVKMTIDEIKIMEPAAVNDDFFQKGFGPEVNSIEAAKEKIKEELERQYLHQAEALLFRDIQGHLLDVNKMDMPESFLKRWLKTQDPRLTDQAIDDDFPDFTQNLLWTMMRDKFLEKYNIQITSQDIRNRMRQQFLNYLGGMALGDTSFLDSIIDKSMKNREQVEKLHDEILTDRLFDSLKAEVKLEETPISEEEFKALMEAARKDSAERRKKTHHHDHDHDHDHNHDHDHDHDHHDHDHDHDHDHKH